MRDVFVAADFRRRRRQQQLMGKMGDNELAATGQEQQHQTWSGVN